MYETRQLEVYPYFRAQLRDSSLPQLHDPLTGLLMRQCILGFIHALIDEGTPFSLAIFDLDNFKNVNDRWGHSIGDELLARIALDLRDYLGDAGFVGRLGGDEFLLVNLRDLSYDEAHLFFDGMYDDKRVFRRTLTLGQAEIYVTATAGCAAFPQDADNYDALFQLADKTLYRGKAKGRNCFILYVAQKHRDIQIRALNSHSLCDTFRGMAEGFDSACELLTKLQGAFVPVRQSFYLQRLWLLEDDGLLLDVDSGEELGRVKFPELLRTFDMLPVGTGEDMAKLGALGALLTVEGMDSALFTRVGGEEERFGCLVFCPEAHTLRVWQDKECAAAFILSRMLAQELRRGK